MLHLDLSRSPVDRPASVKVWRVQSCPFARGTIMTFHCRHMCGNICLFRKPLNPTLSELQFALGNQNGAVITKNAAHE